MRAVIQYPPGKDNRLPETVELPESYFNLRYMWLDARGPLHISATSHWGNGVIVITRSHAMDDGEFSTTVVDRPVRVDEGAQVYSFSLLYNCHIKHHAVVACGAVVRNMTVEPWTMVEGNPARVTRYWNPDKKKWMEVEKT